MVKLKDRSTGKEYLFFGSQDSANSNRPTIWRKELPSGSWSAVYYNSNYAYCLGLNGFENTLIVSFYDNSTNDVRILRCENPFDTSPTFETMQQWSSTYAAVYWIEKRYNKSIENYDLYTTFEKAAGGGTVLRSRDRGETWTAVDDQDTTFAVRSRNIYATDHTIYVAWEGDGSNNYGGIRSSTDEGSTWTTEITSTCYGFIPMSSKTPFVYTADNSATGTGQIKIMRKVEPYTLLGSYSDSSVVSSYGDNPRFHSYLTVSDLKTLSGVKTVAQNYVDSYKVPRKTLKLSVPLDISYQLLSYININSKQNADLNGSYYVMDVEYDFTNARCVISLDNRPYDDLDAIVDRMKLEIEKNSTSLLSGRVIRYNSTNNTCDIVLDTTNPNELRRMVLYSIHCAGVTPTKGEHVYLMSPHFDRSRYVVISKD
ncbi:MAG: hypothetical protein DRN09_03065 [Thermoplasmata archaeon]|nr:MAG: hypothetical protein DRN09_03065 [Thermoplasmata archaeon]